METKENGEEIVMDNNTEPAGYVEIAKTSNHRDEETLMNSRSNNFERNFKECRKNHAISIGGYALDGCGEFLPAGIEGTNDYFKCAACTCHRNFHRREIGVLIEEHTSFPFNNPRTDLEENVHVVDPINCVGTYNGGEGSSKSKKRFRSKFTREQKEKMLGFAIKSGWKIHKQDEKVVEEFCNEIGVKCHVLKVWMHNNKHTLGNKH